ncbi:MAG: hypothetical protein JWM36_4159 [Hyphomicrobiales bacterium]|nr:hypothetical protein [Hyphomicrobiales bacterium]
MDVSTRAGADAPRTLYLPQTGEDGCSYVIITRPGEAPEYHPCRDKEEACFWARRWMWRDRIQRWEGDLFGTAWIDSQNDH